MSDNHSPEYFKGKFRKYIWAVGTILIVGTIVSFTVDLLYAEKMTFRQALYFGLGIACIKATAVILYFMHLLWDIKFKTISITLACTIAFFIGMIWLSVGSEVDSVKPGQDDTTWLHGTQKDIKFKENPPPPDLTE